MSSKKFPIVYQADLHDCGPACLKMVSDYFGGSYTLPFIRELCCTTKTGTTLLNMGKASDRLGLRALAIRCTMDNLLNDIPLPTIMFWKESHFIVVYLVNKECIMACDPMIGYVLFTPEDFRKEWYLREEEQGILLAFEKKHDRE